MAVKAINANKENGRVSVGTFERYYEATQKSPKHITFGDGDNAFDVAVVPILGMQESIDFTRAFVNTVFQNDGSYYAALQEFALRHATLVFYTNMTMPNDASKEFDLLMGTDVYDRVVELIDSNHYSIIVKAALEQLDYEYDLRMSDTRTSVDNAVSEMKRLAQNYETFMDSVQKLVGPELFKLAKRLKASAGNVTDAAAEFRQRMEDASINENSQKHGGTTATDRQVDSVDTGE